MTSLVLSYTRRNLKIPTQKWLELLADEKLSFCVFLAFARGEPRPCSSGTINTSFPTENTMVERIDETLWKWRTQSPSISAYAFSRLWRSQPCIVSGDSPLRVKAPTSARPSTVAQSSNSNFFYDTRTDWVARNLKYSVGTVLLWRGYDVRLGWPSPLS